MQKLQSFIYWACVTSEISHVFCCGLPMVFSVLSLLSGVGLITVMPAGLVTIHEALHAYEIPMIATSGVIILLGWALHYIAYRMDCRSTGCVHEPCKPKKKRSAKVLVVATALFVLNVSGYVLLHHGH
jgi:cytochrome b subunit of formate dehydrogenase